MDTISLPLSRQLYVVVGRQTATLRLLDLAAQLALRGPLLILDCGNCANPLVVARHLRRLTFDPAPALERIQTARAFTCYQVVALLEQVSQLSLRCPVMIFDLLATLYDESVHEAEARRLLEQSIRCIQQLRQTASLLVSARPPHADFAERQVFVERLCWAADQHWVEEAAGAAQAQQLSLF